MTMSRLFLKPLCNKGIYGNPLKRWGLPQFGDIAKWTLFEGLAKAPKQEDLAKVLPHEEVNLEEIALKPKGKNVRATWMGHSSYLIQTSEVSFLTDPVWSKRCSPFQFAGPKRLLPPPVDLLELHKHVHIDFVLVSHNHYDHLDWLAVKSLQNETLWIVPEGLGEWFRKNGVNNVHELSWGQSLFPKTSVRVTSTPALHWSSRGVLRNRCLWCSFVVESVNREEMLATAMGNSNDEHEFIFPTPGELDMENQNDSQWLSELSEKTEWVSALTPSYHRLYWPSVQEAVEEEDKQADFLQSHVNGCRCQCCQRHTEQTAREHAAEVGELPYKRLRTSVGLGATSGDSTVPLVDGDVSRIFFCGDSGYSQHVFSPIGDTFSRIDLALLPIGAYKPSFIMKNQHMDPCEAVNVHKDIHAVRSLAMHWGTFILTSEPVVDPPRVLREVCEQNDLSEEDFQTIGIGIPFEFSTEKN